MKHFVLAITFLTRIYIPNKYEYSDADFGKSLWHFPMVGAIVGVILAGVCYGL
ncbi:MAG: adenosylcobinamide-GDP ribazoletransferase, partial [Vallitaleaceae bacterium]|nr:adenosylcobinamide-GDP ribazoletransferase [Vallitaleaceae bacterium]